MLSIDSILHSDIAQKENIDNRPATDTVSRNIDLLIKQINEISKGFGHPISISSGYRSPELNSRVGGASASRHCSGEAADLYYINFSEQNSLFLYQYIKQWNSTLPSGSPRVHECYLETNKSTNNTWVHLSFNFNGVGKEQFGSLIKGKGNKVQSDTNTNSTSLSAQSTSSANNTPWDKRAKFSDPQNIFVFTAPSNNTTNFDSSAAVEEEEATDKNFKDIWRIWQSKKPSIQKDELSWTVDQDPYASSIDYKLDYEKPQDQSSDTGAYSHTYPGAGAGSQFPVIRINDYYIPREEITHFEVDCTGFVPKLKLRLNLLTKELIKGKDAIKEGDICAVFFTQDPNDNVINPIREDFRITSAITQKVASEKDTITFSIVITGELNIPDLYNSNMTFAFSGTSRDALIDVAEKLKLGFNFNNPNNTNDVQIWSSVPHDKNGPDLYIKEVLAHAWMDETTFFDGWIDERYALNFIDIGEMLGKDGPDEGVDITKFTRTLNDLEQSLGNKINPDTSTGKMLKVFANFAENAYNLSPYYVEDYRVFNNATAVTRQVGLNWKGDLLLNNSGIDKDNKNVSLDYKVLVNKWKLNNGFYALLGPGINESYQQKSLENGVYSQQEAKSSVVEISEVNSDGDADTILETGSNELASGNVSKTYDMAYNHNYINNMQLKKQYIDITCRGLNVEIMRGERVPVVLKDYDTASIISAGADPYALIDTIATGWFIIAGIKWIYDPEAATSSHALTSWKTVVTLTRREWPIPMKTQSPDSEKTSDSSVLTLNVGNGTEKPAALDSSVNTVSAKDVAGNITTDGLMPYMIEFWDRLKEISEVTLTSAKRWAVDLEGNKVNGDAFVKRGSKYKVINSDGTISYYSNKSSKHLYGEAIDVISPDLSQTIYDIINDDTLLEIMYKNGLSLKIEKDTETSLEKHLDISTDTISQDAWWNIVKKANPTAYAKFANYMTKTSAVSTQNNDIVIENV